MKVKIKQRVLNGRGFAEHYGRDWLDQEIELIDNPTPDPVAVDRDGNVIGPSVLTLVRERSKGCP